MTSCKNICKRYKVKGSGSGNPHYFLGHKRCGTCEIFIEFDGIRCPCCKRQLKVKPRSRRSKEIFQDFFKSMGKK